MNQPDPQQAAAPRERHHRPASQGSEARRPDPPRRPEPPERPEPARSPEPTGAAARRGPFRAGERVQLTDERERMNTVTLTAGAAFHTHKGFLNHDELIGKPEGSVVANNVGQLYQALRPLLSDFVLSMPRGAAVVYPKDAGQIITMGDIYPGARVVEAGVGSGALSISLLRAVGDGGYLHSFERREEFAAIARGNVETIFGGAHPGWKITLGDFQDQVVEQEAPGSIDRVVLDMLAPWECVDAVATVLAPGGVWINYVATVTQLSRTAEAIRADGRFTAPDAWESMVRGWHLEGLAVRPDHRMVAHTGFLMVSRRLANGVLGLTPKRRPSKTEFSQEDLNAWTPASVGERAVSDRKLRRAAREASSTRQRGASPDAVGAPQSDEAGTPPPGAAATPQPDAAGRGLAEITISMLPDTEGNSAVGGSVDDSKDD